jgi:hypothetical protein
MARTKRWNRLDFSHGQQHIKLSSWKYFYDYIRQELLDYQNFIWRGQRRADWILEPRIDRVTKYLSKKRRFQILDSHLHRFKFASRGRRGSTPLPLETDNEWWALGQHHGLMTPLLDWTSSPFVAAYFAFIGNRPNQRQDRAVFALWRDLSEGNAAALKSTSEKERAPTVQFVRPLSGDNPRLVSQGGEFTRIPTGVDLEKWIQTYYPADHVYSRLIKITIPNKDRKIALRSLNRMNINHLSLFPDLYGSSAFCNMDLEIDNY